MKESRGECGGSSIRPFNILSNRLVNQWPIVNGLFYRVNSIDVNMFKVDKKKDLANTCT